VEHGEVSVGAFLPAGEDAPEAVEPGVRPLDDPAAGANAGLASELLFAAGADVCGEAELAREFANLVVVVAAVEAKMLRLRRAWLRPLDRDRLDRGAGEPEVV
jgi:hypothetical protein